MQHNISADPYVKTEQMKVRYQQYVEINMGKMQDLRINGWKHEQYLTKLHKKSTQDFDWYLVQGFKAHSDSIWVAKFSPDGQFLATGGKDSILKIWQMKPNQT